MDSVPCPVGRHDAGVSLFHFFQELEIILPSAWGWKVCVIKPYADGKIGAWFVSGARCLKNGLQRFKLGGQESFVMQKIDMKNIYRNSEVFVVSLGTVRKFYATLMVDFEKRKLITTLENPKMAQLYLVDSLKEGDMNQLSRHVPLLNNLIIYWCISTVCFGFSTFIVVFPWFLRGLGYGR